MQGDNQLETQGQTDTSKKRLNGRPWLICCRLGREEDESAIEAGNLNSADVVKEFPEARRNSGDPCGWQTEAECASP